MQALYSYFLPWFSSSENHVDEKTLSLRAEPAPVFNYYHIVPSAKVRASALAFFPWFKGLSAPGTFQPPRSGVLFSRSNREFQSPSIYSSIAIQTRGLRPGEDRDHATNNLLFVRSGICIRDHRTAWINLCGDRLFVVLVYSNRLVEHNRMDTLVVKRIPEHFISFLMARVFYTALAQTIVDAPYNTRFNRNTVVVYKG